MRIVKCKMPKMWVLVLLVAAPTPLKADLYLPREGEQVPGSIPTSVVEEFDAPRKWDSATAGLPATVSYGFIVADESLTEGTSLRTLTSIASSLPLFAMGEIRAAFDAWSAVANITFNEVADNVADIRIAAHAFDGSSGTLAHAVTSFFVTSPLQTIISARIDFDMEENWQVNSIGNGNGTIDIFQVAAHEIGHAIGLGHEPFDEMNPALMNPFYSEAFTGPQQDDINGAQFLYGVVAVPEPSAFVFGGLVCSVLGLKQAHKRRSSMINS